ncbi:MAG TPA: phage major capsid protein [Thermoguttaceae bacterium]|nr:phage major capsid protein [Thermoguttaceae bacterium]
MSIDQMCERLTTVTSEIDALLGSEENPRTEQLSDQEREDHKKLETEADDLKRKIEQHTADQEARRRNTARRSTLSTTSRGRQAPLPEPIDQLDDLSDKKDRENIRRRIRRTGGLRSFRGENAHQDAFESGQFLLATIAPNTEAGAKAAIWCRENLAASGADNAKGGATVPEAFENAVIDLREQYGRFRPNCKQVQMTSDTKIVPRRTGGLTAYFVGDNTEITESDKTWDNVRLTARKIAVLAKFSSEVDEDSVISMADDLADEASYAFAVKEDQCGFLGTGTSTYGGMSGLITECTTATATTVTALATHLQFSDFTFGDFESMVGKLPDYAEPRAKWYISRAGWAASMLRLLDAAGGNTRDMLEGKATLMFLGYPVVLSQVMNSTLTDQTTTKGFCYFGDLTLAASFGNRRGVTVKSSDQRYIELDQLAVQVTERFDINVHDVGDTSNPGAMIMLATPGS